MTSTSGAIAFAARRTSMPVRPGILRSVTTRSIPPPWSRSSAPRPSEARMTRNPSRVSVRSRLSRSPGSSSAISSVAGSDMDGPLDRQPDREDRARARAVRPLDLAAVLLRDLARDREAEAGALRLRGEELLEEGGGEAGEGQVLLGERVQRADLLADGREQARRLLYLPRRPPLHDVAQHLGVEPDGSDRVAHLVGDLERQAPDGGHALGHHELLLRGLELRQRPLELLV